MSSIHDKLLEAARNGPPPPVPIPIGEGFPDPELKDCDEKGRVWAIGELEMWVRVERTKIKALGWKAWLPANALPLIAEPLE